MQDASDAFDRAAGSGRAWLPPRLRTDWDGNGYDGDHTADDLSPQVSSTWTVAHDLDDGYPNSVSFVSGTAVPELTAEMTGRAVGGVRMSAAAYWSPLRVDSPIYGYDRDLAPVTLDAGLVTANGPEYVRVFTGQMVSTPVKQGSASLTAVSATRFRLMKAVQPYAVSNIYSRTLMSSWPISWCLYACGVYAGPSPRPGTVAYYPMHGGLWRFHDAEYPNGNLTTSFEQWQVVTNTPTVSTTFEAGFDWIRGPYVAAPDLYLTTAVSRRAFTTLIPLGDTTWGSTDLLSQTAAAGRLEFWIRGDNADYNTAPGGSASVTRLCGFQATAEGGAYVQFGVDVTRHVYVTVYDTVNTRTLQSTGTLPTDGAWYFVGAAFDAVADKLWVNLNGTVESLSASLTQAGMPLVDAWFSNDQSPFMVSYLPFSDLTVATGAQANVDSFPEWRNGASFAPTATVQLTTNEITAVAEIEPREAWKIISDYAQSELAMMRCDEEDHFLYLPLSWWVRDEQQAVRDMLSTAANAAAFDIDVDPSRIRTSVKVAYSQLDNPSYSVTSGVFRRTFELSATSSSGSDVALLPGLNDLRFTFSTPVLFLDNDIAARTGAEAAADALSASASYVTLNDEPDGSGTEYAWNSVPAADVDITLLAWDPGGATIRFVNGTGVILYFANSTQAPVMCLTGVPATVTQTYVQVGDDGGDRGQRLLDANAPGIQQEVSAQRFAQNLLNFLRLPMVTIGDESSGINVTADPRRQPGDLVAIEDRETGVNGSLWRLQAVRHKGGGDSYTQEVVARQVYPIAIVEQTRVGQSLVGPSD